MAQGAEIAPGSSLHPCTLLKPSPSGNWISHCQPITDQQMHLWACSNFRLLFDCKGGIRPKATDVRGDTKTRPWVSYKGPSPGRTPLQTPRATRLSKELMLPSPCPWALL